MSFIYKFLMYVVYAILCVILPIVISMIVWYIIYRIQGIKRKKGEYQYVGYGSFLKKIFIEFPRQKIYDYLTSDPDAFREYGFHLITGKQGTGKTITLVYLLQRFQKMYPKLKVKTNMAYIHEDDVINDWKDLIHSNNGIYGEIDVLDEVQNWFSSNASKNFPPEMLAEITQQRKQRKMIIGTSQVFTRVSKPIRENVYLVYEPKTFFGCITLVRRYEPVLDENGIVKDKNKLKPFFFVHNKTIRDSFDTYKKIEKMGEIGFQEKNNIYRDSESASQGS